MHLTATTSGDGEVTQSLASSTSEWGLGREDKALRELGKALISELLELQVTALTPRTASWSYRGVRPREVLLKHSLPVSLSME